MWDCGGKVVDCTFRDVDDGAILIRSTTEVEGCDFTGVRERGIAHDPYSELIIGENEYGTLDDGVVEEDQWPRSTQPYIVQMDDLCVPIVLVISIVGLTFVFIRIRWLQVTGGRPKKKYITPGVMKGPDVDQWTERD